LLIDNDNDDIIEIKQGEAIPVEKPSRKPEIGKVSSTAEPEEKPKEASKKTKIYPL
jgi:hypothetical protein